MRVVLMHTGEVMQRSHQDLQFNCQNMVRDIKTCMKRLRTSLGFNTASPQNTASLEARKLETQIFSQ